MIHFLLLQNRQGKTRLAKYYSPFEHEEKRQLEAEVHKLITKRDPKFTNFIEVRTHHLSITSHRIPSHTPHLLSLCPPSTQPSTDTFPVPSPVPPTPLQFRRYKIIYRRYAGLYFSYCVDVNDNELAYLESIHLFVELLDKFFASVCELDLVFNFHKIYSILDEVYLGGEIQETSKRVILERLQEIQKLE